MTQIAEHIKQYLEKHGFEHFMPKAVLFDMDGVLINSMPNHAVAWVKAMAECGLKMTSDDAYITEGQKGTDTIRQMARQQLGRELSQEEAQKMYDIKAHYFSLLPEAPVMPGIMTLMNKIKRSGMKIVVVTGSGQRPLIERLKGEFKGFVEDDKIITAYDVEHGKPAPDPYLMGLSKAGGLQPWEAIVVENAPLGVRAGVAAQIFTVAVNTGPLPDEALWQEGADLVMPDMVTFAKQWHSLVGVRINQEDIWFTHYRQVFDFICAHKKRPSKYRADEIAMVNWIKYNKKQRASGKLQGRRLELFDHLLTLVEQYRKINQNAYAHDQSPVMF